VGAEAQLAFKDWSSLGILDDARSKRWRRNVVFDVLSKKELLASRAHGRGLKIRRCTRCGCTMEDLIPPRDRPMRWNYTMSRTCLCGGH